MSAVKQPMTLDSGSNQNEGAVCIPNISTAERRKRLKFAVMAFAVSLAVLAILVVTGVDRVWRLPLFLLFCGATTSFFQWHDKTCVALARADSRIISDKLEKIEDPVELAQVRRQARQVQIKGILAAILLTLIALILPVL